MALPASPDRPSLQCTGLPYDATKADVACRRIDRLRMPGRRPVAAAVVRRAQVRAALEHLPWNPDLRLARVVALLLARPARISRRATGLALGGGMRLGVPVLGPLPGVADHVVEAIAVRREGGHRRRALETVLVQVLVRELALPGVGHVPAAGRELVAPGELGAIGAAARGQLPLGLRRQVLAGPARVGLRIGEAHVHHWVVPTAA